jgi:replicative DNA helicase
MMPNNAEAESAVLGSVILDNGVLAELTLAGDDFYKQANRIIFSTMRKMAAEHKPIDLVTLVSRLKQDACLDTVGGIAYVTSLANYVPSASNATYYAGLVLECAKRRKVMEIASESANRAAAGDEDSDTILDDMQHRITDAMLRNGSSDVQSTQDLIMGVSEWIEKRAQAGDNTGIKSGFTDVDKLTHGWQAGDLDLIAARPSMGKTAFALNIAVNACKTGKSVAFFSLEMPKEQLVSRIIASEAAINTSKLFVPASLTEAEHSKVTKMLETMYDQWHLFVEDRSGITPVELNAKARRIRAKYGLDLVIIDYLQLMNGGKDHNENRTQEVSYITRSLKGLAKDLQVPVIALSQLSRAAEQRQDKRPMLSDLRESGSIEQDADLVMFLYREDYYKPTTDKKYSELIIAKQRNGPLGTVGLYFAKEYTRFADLALGEDTGWTARQFGEEIPQKQWCE